MAASVNRIHVLAGITLLATPLVFAQCTPTTTTNPEPPQAPIAVISDLGEDASIELGQTIVLDGAESALGANTDGLDLTLTYFWEIDTKPFGSEVVDESLVVAGTSLPGDDDDAYEGDPALPETASVEFTPDLVGLYGVTLQVSDGLRVSDLDHVVISVGSTNVCPTADAGADVIALTGQPTTLDGTNTSDPDVNEAGDPQALEWQWHFSLVPGGSELTDADIFSQGTAQPQIIPDVAGTYILQLRVSDGVCTSDPEYVTVLASNGNGQPVAEAGQSILLTPCSPSEVSLDGTASFDTETAALDYEWSFTDTPDGSALSDALIEGRFTATPSFNWDVPGVYTLQLLVSDGEMTSEPDYVAVRAVPPLPNQAPVAVAGDNIVVNTSANCTSNPYTGCSCSPCGSRSVVVEASAYDPDLDPLNYSWIVQSGNGTLLGEQSPIVELTFPDQPVSCNSTSSSTVTVKLTVFDCRAADEDEVTVTFNCNG